MFQKHLALPLESTDINSFMDLLEALGAHYQQNTMNTIRAVLRGFLKFCDRGDDARRIKYANIKWMPRCDLTQEQLAQVLATSRPNERAAILTFYSTAARLGELCGMRFEHERPQVQDIDWIAGKIKIIGKGRRTDYLVFFPRRDEAVTALHDYIGQRHSGPILPNRKHTYLLVRRAGARAGIKLHPHTLRHCGCHSLAMQNVNSRIIQAWMRHTTLAMTERYSAMSKSNIITVAEQREWR
jgi:integrase/recombinase XerD